MKDWNWVHITAVIAVVAIIGVVLYAVSRCIAGDVEKVNKQLDDEYNDNF